MYGSPAHRHGSLSLILSIASDWNRLMEPIKISGMLNLCDTTVEVVVLVPEILETGRDETVASDTRSDSSN